ncbi:unnamed protein product [Miscanthus lutarioriparius]|uniref:Uncharacterized protein n=1 Tax=Miscanthus lutarioriparius TaxID=422564 RepID=A0A811NET5_9POAL|nr:unnamed protein product [Miscanthus lutarioriparius]CAD6220731.1 unnamed protein product [Miscanthus lutarioriparius]CAD6343418.1 unnamed protein product [Miscanthus lutarioriparius]
MPLPRTLLLLLLLVTVLAACLSASESIGDGKQVYIVYLGHLPSTDASEPEGFSAVEFAHHDLLVLHDGRSEILFSPESNT